MHRVSLCSIRISTECTYRIGVGSLFSDCSSLHKKVTLHSTHLTLANNNFANCPTTLSTIMLAPCLVVAHTLLVAMQEHHEFVYSHSVGNSTRNSLMVALTTKTMVRRRMHCLQYRYTVTDDDEHQLCRDVHDA